MTYTNGSILMNKYKVGKLLGQGTFAKVYCGKHLVTGQCVAIKVMDKENILKIGLINQIKREISVMRLVKHPNVVELYEVMATKTKIYFIMEYVKGGELFKKISKGRLREGDARKYFQQLVGAIEFCHSRGVYHRDLKPENLLLDENGNLKITDFGLSALHDTKKKDGLLHTTCGTPAYVAPEVINQKGYDGPKADIWSCGVVLYVLLAGFLPFQDTNLMDLYKKISKGEFKCPGWFAPEVRKLLSKILDPNPNQRISVAKVKQNPWFKKGLKFQLQLQIPTNFIPSSQELNPSGQPITPRDVRAAFSIDPDNTPNPSPSLSPVRRSNLSHNNSRDNFLEEEENEKVKNDSNTMKPTSLNAFEIISSLSQGLDLRRLFETEPKESRFTTAKPPSLIISRLEEVAKSERFMIEKSNEGKVKLKSSKEGRKGWLKIDAEIFEVAPTLHVVEVKKVEGDTMEYNQFCNHDLRPALRDIVWIWQDNKCQVQPMVH